MREMVLARFSCCLLRSLRGSNWCTETHRGGDCLLKIRKRSMNQHGIYLFYNIGAGGSREEQATAIKVRLNDVTKTMALC